MASKKKIDIELSFTSNYTKLKEVEDALYVIQEKADSISSKGIPLDNNLQASVEAAKTLQKILNSSWNTKLGQLDLTKFNKSIEESFGSIQGLREDLTRSGEIGEKAFYKTANAVLKTNTQMKQSNKLLNDLATSMSNTIKWGLTSGVFNTLTNSVQQAWNYSLKLDSSLNDIRIVTGNSADEMERFARIANTAAKQLGASTLDYTKAALIYYQQGLSEEDVQARANTTLKVANVTGQSGNAVSEQLTAVWNGYKVSAAEAEQYIDKLSAVAAATASDLEELSTGMGKVASAANSMGVDIDQLNAQLATIISVTRQAPESVGTALKTIFARMTDIEAGTEENGVTLGKYTAEMAAMGVRVLDSSNKLRNMGDVIEEVGSKWNTFTREQQVALAQTMAGTRQYNNLIALFDNWDMYTDAIETSKNSTGELQKQQDIYMESTEAHLQQLRTEAEKTYKILFDDTAIKTMTKSLTGLLNLFNNFLSGLGGGLSSLSFLGLGAANIFSSQISEGIITNQYNKQREKQKRKDQVAKKDWFDKGSITNINSSIPELTDYQLSKTEVDLYKRFNELSGELSPETSQKIEKMFEKLETPRKNLGDINTVVDALSRYQSGTQIEDGVAEGNAKAFQSFLDDMSQKQSTTEDLAFFLEDKNNEINQVISEYTKEYAKKNLMENEMPRMFITLEKQLGETEAGSDAEKEIKATLENLQKKRADWYNSYNEEYFTNFEDKLQNAFENMGIKNLSYEGQEIVDRLMGEIQNSSFSFAQNYEQAYIKKAIEELKKEGQMIQGDYITTSDAWNKNLKGKINKQNPIGDVQKQNILDFQNLLEQISEDIKLENTKEDVAALVSSVSTLVSTGISLSGVIKTIKDDTLTLGDKLSQILPVAGVTLTQIIMNWKNFGTGLETVTKSMVKFAKTNHNVISLQTTKGIPAFMQATKAFLGTKVAIGSTTVAMGTLIGVIGGVVAAIGLLIYALIKLSNRQKDDLDSAKKQTAALQENYNTLTKEANEFKKSISDYNKAIKALKNLKEGTDEYKTSLEAVNEQAKQLIETYGLWNNYVMKNGVITIDSEKIEDIQSQKNQQALTAEGLLYGSKMIQDRSQQIYDTSRLQKKTGLYYQGVNYRNGEDTITHIIKDINAEREKTGTNEIFAREDGLRDFIQTTYAGNNVLLSYTDTIVENKAAFESLADSVREAKKANEYYADQLNISKIKSQYGEKITELATNEDGDVNEGRLNQIAQIINNSEIQRINREHIASETRIAGSTGKQWEQEAFKGNRNAEVQTLAEEYGYLDKGEFEKRFGRSLVNDDSNENLLKLYAEQIAGLSPEEVASLTMSKGNLVDAQGKTVVAGSTAAERGLVRSQIYNLILKEYLEDVFSGEEDAEKQLIKVETFMDKISDVKKKASIDYTDTILNAMGNEKGEFDFSDISNQINLKERKALLGKSDKEIQEYFGIDDDLLKQTAWGNGETFAKAFKEGLENTYDIDSYLTKVKEKTTALSDVLTTYQSGKTPDQDQLTELESYYEELKMITQKGSHEYLEALREAREREEDETRRGLEEQQTDIAKKIVQTKKEMQEIVNKLANNPSDAEKVKLELELKGKFDTLNKQIKDYSDKGNQIKVQVRADLASDVDNAFGLASEFGNIQNLLSDDLELTFAEAQNIIDSGYGEILTDAKETANQTIKINAQVKDAYIKNKQEEFKASKEKDIKELEASNIKLETQYKILEQEQQALEKALTAETEAEKIQFLAQAMLLDEQYNIEIEKMKKEIEANDIKNGKLSTQEENLFNAFNAMYQGDLKNQDSYLEQMNNKFSKAFSNIVEYAKNAGKGISLAWKKLTGDDSISWKDVKDQFKLDLDDGTSGEDITSTYVSDTETKLNKLKDELSEMIKDAKENTKKDEIFNLDKVIEARKRAVEAEMKIIKDQIGANDAGIAALKSAWDSLESARKTAGTKEYQKELEKEKDLYHDINIEIQKLTTQIERLQKEQDKLVGQKLVDNLNAQTKALNAQADAIQRKIKVNAEYEKKYLQGLLAEQGVLFNEQGDISNYDEIFDTHYKYLQELDRQKRNTDNKDAKNSISNLLSQEENDFDKMIKYIERYDTLMTQDIPSWEDSITEALDNVLEISLKKFNLNIELRLDIAEGVRDWNEFKKTIIDEIKDDDILGNAKAELENFYSYYNDEGIGAVQAGMDHVNDILFELREMDKGFTSDFYGEDRANALEDLEKYYKQLMSDLTDVQELSETVRQSYLDMMDKAKEDFDQQISSYEQVANLLDHDMKLIELIYGEKSYGALDKYYQKLEDNYNSQLDFQKQQVDFWREQMDSAEEGTERWEKARDNWTAAVTDWKSLVNDAIENINDKYLNTIKNIFEELNNKVTNGAGLEYVKEEWDLINKNSEQYLDNINAMYGIEQLASKYQQAIDNTDSVSAQRKLNDLMTKELAALKEKDKLSEYDVERANKKYEIALKQIALEEAQQNKTSMRLRRDSQGNYSYQFVANEDDIAKAEDDLAAAKNALYNFDKENYLNNLDEMYSAYEEYQQKMFEAAQINDPEERAKKELLINEQYNELINSLTEKNQTIRNNLHESAFEELSRLYDTDLEHYKQMTEEQKNILLNDLIPQWTSGVQQMADTFAGEGGLKEVCKDALLELEEATEDYRKSLEEIEASAEVAFDKVYNGEDRVIEQTRDLISENEELIGTYEDQLDAVQSVIDKLDELLNKYKEVTAAAKETAQAGYEYKYNEDSSNDKTYNDSIDWSRKMAEAARQHRNITNADYQRYLKRRDDKIERNGGITSVDSDRLGRLFEAYNAGDSDAAYIVDQVLNGKENFTDEFLRSRTRKFATGGYTGNWAGNEGKLAFLHSKELVLNKEDTENVLGAVQILRSINNAIGSSVLQQAAQLSGNLAAAKVGNTNGFTDTLEQNVHIEAVFPNVTKSQEIENALNNLVNTASQRSLRKR